MYRIKLSTGDEANYGSIDELAQAVKAGSVTDTSAIYHARAEKWLPIASHPHYKMAKERVFGRAPGAAPKPTGTGATNGASAQRPALGTSGQRPAITASGQRPAMPGAPPRNGNTAPRATAPQSAVPGTHNGGRVVTAERPVRAPAMDRRTAPQTAPRPAVVRAESASAEQAPARDLGLLRADAAIEQDRAATARLPEVELEHTPTIEEPQVVTQAPANVKIEQVPEPVHLESADETPTRGGIELIHPDRVVTPQPMEVVHVEEAPAPKVAATASRPVVPPSLDIPAPVQDFTPVEPTEAPASRARSKAPLFIGLGLAAAAAVGALVFLRKPAAPKAPVTETRAAPTPVTPPPAPPAAVGSAPAQDVPAVDQSTGPRQQASSSRRRDTEPDPNGADGLEPPPPLVIPAAPSVNALTDAAALPTVDAAAPDLVNRKKALEQTVREIDSSMRRESGKSGGSTR